MTPFQDALLDSYQDRFERRPEFLARAPGRVNLIGEHTDYNEGFVFPMAIDRETAIALRPREDSNVILHSLNHDQTMEIDLGNLEKGKGWIEYVKGTAWALNDAGYSLKGWEGVTHCNVPLGAGLSSSASFELAVAKAFQCVSSFDWDPHEMAVLCQKAENDWVGMNCGIMDQMISAAGKKGHALLIDCHDLSFSEAPIPDGAAIVIMDTGTRRGLVDSAYNERRSQCDEACRYFGVSALRFLSVEELEAGRKGLDGTTYRRARHVVTENQRTVEIASVFRGNGLEAAGKLMNQSHESLHSDFEVTNEALDLITESARSHEACYGARMTGAGFGGCAVALVADDRVESFTAHVLEQYSRGSSFDAALYMCRAADGASSEIAD